MLFVACWPGFLLQLSSISSELATAFFGALLIWSALRPLPAGVSLILGILSATAMVWIRSNTLLFVLPWLIFYGVVLFSRSQWPALRRQVVIAAIVLLAYGGWSARNKKWCGDWVFSAYLGQVLYLHYQALDPADTKWADGAEREAFIRTRVAQGARWSQAEREMYRELTASAWNRVTRFPGRALVSVARAGVGFFWDSYFRIPDLLWARVHGLALVDQRKINLQDPHLPAFSRALYLLTRGVFLCLRFALLILFLMFPYWMWKKKALSATDLALWGSVGTFLAATAVVSDTGDRQLLPVVFFVLLFAWRLISLMPQFQHQQRP